MNRRDFLFAGAVSLCAGVSAAGSDDAFPVQSLRAPEPMAQMRADDASGLLLVSVAGVLWQWAAATSAWTRLADAIDAATPVAVGHGRIAARLAHGGLWVQEAGRAKLSREVRLASHAGMLNLPLGIIGVVDAGGRAYAARFEIDGSGQWVETARSTEVVMPDARPVQIDFDTADGVGEGDVVLLAGPDDRRYIHGVLGDAIESTRVLYLDRHTLIVLRSLAVDAPHVIEDIAPKPVQWRGKRGLLTMRSGPQGAQLVVIAASSTRRNALEFAAVGAPIGMPGRWMAATTDGNHLLAVHTPHIGGVLHAYQADGGVLRSRIIDQNVANHRIGSRELDLATWIGQRLMLPAQNRRSLRCFDAGHGWGPCGTWSLPAPIIATSSLTQRGRPGVAALMENGQVVVATMEPHR